MLRVVLVVVLLVLSRAVLALSWGDLQPEITKLNNKKKADAKVMAHLVSTVDTAIIYTKALQAQEMQPLFCLPASSPMGLREVLAVIAAQAGQQHANSDTPIGELFIRGMSREFGCKN